MRGVVVGLTSVPQSSRSCYEKGYLASRLGEIASFSGCHHVFDVIDGGAPGSDDGLHDNGATCRRSGGALAEAFALLTLSGATAAAAGGAHAARRRG